MNSLEYFSQIINHRFKDANLLYNALTHSSYANEKGVPQTSNERLEFLGDSVLSVIISEYLYSTEKKLAEGEMSKIRAQIVCEESLADCATRIGIGGHLRLGRGEELSGGRQRPSILADALEALIAALYLDAGFDKAKHWVLTALKKEIDDVTRGKRSNDYKTLLQEKLQSVTKEKIEYLVTGETGPDHNKEFTVSVTVGGRHLGDGMGKSKKAAEQAAAKNALASIEI